MKIIKKLVPALFFSLLVFSCNTKNKEVLISRENQNKSVLDSITRKHINNIPQFTTGYSHKVMVLGTFHFNRGSDGSDVVAKNHIDVTTEDNQKLIEELALKIAEDYKPTIIAVEWMPNNQDAMDSKYTEYKNTGKLGKNETYQLGFRIAKKLNLPTVYCVDNRPPQPKSIMDMELDFDDYIKSVNQESLMYEYDKDNKAYNDYMDMLLGKLNVLQHLKTINSPENLKRFKAFSFTGLANVGYKDNYVGADFTGMWYQRNTRIYVNTRNLAQTKNERILIIYGAAHKWALDEIFDGSPEFEVIQPFEY